MILQPNPADFDALEDLFVAFAQVFLAHLASEAASQGVSYQYPTSEQWLHYKRTFLTVEATDQCLRKHWEAGLLRFPSHVHLADDAGNPITSPAFEQGRALLFGDLVSPIQSVLKQYGTFQPTKEQMLECYRHFRSLWTATDVHCDIFFPLIHFSSDLEQEQSISSHLNLAPFTFDEKKTIWQEHLLVREGSFSFTLVPVPDLRSLLWVDFKLTGSYYRKRGDLLENSYEHLDIVKEMGNVLTALRLSKSGDVGILGLLEERQVSSVWDQDFVNVLLDEYPTTFWGSTYILNETDLPRVRKIFDALQRLKAVPRRGDTVQSHGELTVALRRFNQVYGRHLIEDRIIDLTIALESSLLAKERDELNYRLSLRGAALLADAEPPWDPSTSQVLLKTMYDVRSGIVHNGQQLVDLEKVIGKLQPVGILPQEFPQQCEDLVRDILRAYVLRLERSRSVEQVNQELDRRIVGGLGLSSDAEA